MDNGKWGVTIKLEADMEPAQSHVRHCAVAQQPQHHLSFPAGNLRCARPNIAASPHLVGHQNTIDSLRALFRAPREHVAGAQGNNAAAGTDFRRAALSLPPPAGLRPVPPAQVAVPDRGQLRVLPDLQGAPDRVLLPGGPARAGELGGRPPRPEER